MPCAPKCVEKKKCPCYDTVDLSDESEPEVTETVIDRVVEEVGATEEDIVALRSELANLASLI